MKNFTDYYEKRRSEVEKELRNSLVLVSNSPLKDNIEYVFSMGGKRVRPLLTIFAAEAVGECSDDAMRAAVAIEILHNFTLVHDDIMDNADTRRGKSTVHITSGVNTAILVGDLMIALAYDCVEKCDTKNLQGIMRIFNEGVKEVCNGQALDESLSKCTGGSMPQYMEMISKKTGALLMTAGKLGALLGGGSEAEIALLGDFGLNIGIAFQILDDMLDLEGDNDRFGKPRGLDIIERKKSYLFLKAQQLMDNNEFKVVSDAYNKTSVAEIDVLAVRDAYQKSGTFDAAKREVAEYTARALSSLNMLKESDGKDALVELANSLVQRRF
ncbi:MAG: polyprenyl synthetase family protein [Bacteroidetes bacterium]|nr:polyprenyl synthetase family protein [Bacteroidota bacterium]